MKKLLLLMVAALASFNIILSQETFEGRIIYTSQFQGKQASQMGTNALKNEVYLISGAIMCIKSWIGENEGLITEIRIDGEKGKVYTLLPKAQMAFEEPSPDTSNMTAPLIEKLDKTLSIAGYPCQKYKVTYHPGSSTELIQYVWVTDSIKVKKHPSWMVRRVSPVHVEGLKGFPLQIRTEFMGTTTIMTADAVEAMPIDPGLFILPEDYKVINIGGSKN